MEAAEKAKSAALGAYNRVRSLGSSTGYEIDGTSGATISVGTPGLKFEISASYLRMPLKNTAADKVIMFQGGGAGIGIGMSLSIPFVNLSGGPDAMPSAGSRILRGPQWNGHGGFRAFEGEVIFVTGTALAQGVSQDFTLAFFLVPLPMSVRLAGAMLPVSMDAATIAPRIKAFGFVTGINFATSLGGFGASAMRYFIKAT